MSMVRNAYVSMFLVLFWILSRDFLERNMSVVRFTLYFECLVHEYTLLRLQAAYLRCSNRHGVFGLFYDSHIHFR